jgi:hypothetical protein
MMPYRLRIILILIAFPFAAFPLTAQRSSAPPVKDVRIGATAGYLTFGSYFTGPGGLRFSNDNAPGYGAEVAVTVWRNLSVIGNILHAKSDWSFEQVPFVGTVTLGGANLWFFDAGLRFHIPLGGTTAILPFVEAGGGVIRYAVNNQLLTGDATNFALVGGVGLLTRLGDRFVLQLRLKDHAASFRSLDDAAALGVRGRWAHTVGFLVGLNIGI